ncbi:MAG TPA: hypothetical protein VFQ65_30975 [Kofleriaceae bacterium]|nr:hypothetical protein [Kofleriaceae bacterium]
MELRPRMSPVAMGACLGFINTLVIAIGMTSHEPGDRIGVVLLITTIGCLPAVLTGAVLGVIAGELAGSPVWLRRALLIPPALGLLGALALVFRMTGFVPVASIPTLAGVLILERRTRGEGSLPSVVAR